MTTACPDMTADILINTETRRVFSNVVKPPAAQIDRAFVESSSFA